MVEFNPDGSLKLPEHIVKEKDQNKDRLKTQRCIKIKRELVSVESPKKCVLHLTLSEGISDDRFIDTIHKEFSEKASVPSRILKVGDRKFEVHIGTDFRRCSDCRTLRCQYREFLDGNMIDVKGGCTFEDDNFNYEDYFDYLIY
ncbi:MAG: hypothetical protein QF632_04460 [Candidatus Woesearchaeota archaeon]|jgi:hypothetical protein|nr:hypothetical protein [Candidatus Woesearchaeota archaeon]|tara:strand:- start:79 stop:510 length:432 start_codon:yes stop_codon:yes gene_type:complete